MSDWLDQFNEILESSKQAHTIVLRDLEKWGAPTEVREVLWTLDQKLRTITDAIINLKWELWSRPWDKLLKGQRLTKEEFYLLAAQGLILVPSRSGFEEAYEEFTHYLYEDNEIIGYINPRNPPNPSGELRLEIGVSPEEVRTSYLSSDQLEYFRGFEPKLFSRFRKD